MYRILSAVSADAFGYYARLKAGCGNFGISRRHEKTPG
jgi:hypothetical protein